MNASFLYPYGLIHEQPIFLKISMFVYQILCIMDITNKSMREKIYVS